MLAVVLAAALATPIQPAPAPKTLPTPNLSAPSSASMEACKAIGLTPAAQPAARSVPRRLTDLPPHKHVNTVLRSAGGCQYMDVVYRDPLTGAKRVVPEAADAGMTRVQPALSRAR